MERAGLMRLTPKWLGKRSDLVSLGGKKTNDDKFWYDTQKTIHRHEEKKIIATMIEIQNTTITTST